MKKKMLKFLLKTRNPSTANASEAVDVEDAVVETVRPATTSAVNPSNWKTQPKV